MKGKGWKGESRRHSMARKGVSTNNNIKVNESSGMLFESKGSVLDVISLFKLVDFGGLLGTKEAKGYTKEEYELDANNVMVYPSGDAEKSIDWMLVEYAEGNQARKNQIKKLLRLAVKQIESRIGQVDDVDVRIELHQSRKLFKEAMDRLNGKASGKPIHRYYTVLVDTTSHTFSSDVINSDKELPSSENIGWFGYGKRFPTKKEQQEFIDYLEKEGNFIEEKELR